MANRALLFRRALKLTNGDDWATSSCPVSRIAAENPVYIHGSWNANCQRGEPGALGEPNIRRRRSWPTPLTLLSDNWNDWNSFMFPYAPGSRRARRTRTTGWPMIAGKNERSRGRPSAARPPTDFGTDGGAHNFLRMLEGGGDRALSRLDRHRSTTAGRQSASTSAVTTVYGAPDTTLQLRHRLPGSAKLPPLTPVFRDTNALGFAQEVRPGK